MPRFAAIDIGSSAVRMLVSDAINEDGSVYFKQVEFIRFPLRIGDDVFTQARIGRVTEEKFLKLMHAFKLLLDLYNPDMYMACATSALRDAKNGKQLAKRAYYNHGLEISIISGEQEASFINLAIASFVGKKNIIHIDVGGGSTEINIFKQGQKIESASFNIGHIRILREKDTASIAHTRQHMEEWLANSMNLLDGPCTGLGTGGNIMKLFNMTEESQSGIVANYGSLLNMRHFINNFSQEDRVKVLKLDRERAEVIIPAADIYLGVMKTARLDEITVPNTGLKEGIIRRLYQEYLRQLDNGH